MKKRLLQDLLIVFLSVSTLLFAFISLMEGFSTTEDVIIKEEITAVSSSLGSNAGYLTEVHGVLRNNSKEDVSVDALVISVSGKNMDSVVKKESFVLPAGSNVPIYITWVTQDELSTVREVTLQTGGDSIVMDNPDNQGPLSVIIPIILTALFATACVHAIRVRILMQQERRENGEEVLRSSH